MTLNWKAHKKRKNPMPKEVIYIFKIKLGLFREYQSYDTLWGNIKIIIKINQWKTKNMKGKS